jgi:hypothetical protein
MRNVEIDTLEDVDALAPALKHLVKIANRYKGSRHCFHTFEAAYRLPLTAYRLPLTAYRLLLTAADHPITRSPDPYPPATVHDTGTVTGR